VLSYPCCATRCFSSGRPLHSNAAPRPASGQKPSNVRCKIKH
jgi:hypothetical protein